MYGNLKRGEDTEQMGVVDWANWNRNRFPELKMLYHTPNGGKRNAAEAARFKAMGVKAGVPDLCLPVPRGGYAGLYIEMKFGKNKTTENQNEWLADLKAQGYLTVVCYSGEDATRMLETYMQQGRTIMQLSCFHPLSVAVLLRCPVKSQLFTFNDVFAFLRLFVDQIPIPQQRLSTFWTLCVRFRVPFPVVACFSSDHSFCILASWTFAPAT